MWSSTEKRSRTVLAAIDTCQQEYRLVHASSSRSGATSSSGSEVSRNALGDIMVLAYNGRDDPLHVFAC